MDNNPKKSKAFIITFIVVLLLLIGGYFLFKNGGVFGTKNSTISKIFAPLLGSSKQKDATSINNVDTTNTDNTNAGNNSNTDNVGGTTGGGAGTGNNSNGTTTNTGAPVVGMGPGSIVPPFNPIPSPSNTDCHDQNGNLIACNVDTSTTSTNNLEQCSDGIDNDADNLVDTRDPGCHTDFDATNSLSYDKNMNNESRKKDAVAIATPGMCPDDPLEFTEEEKAQLAVLLRQYYLLSPTLRIDDDVTLLDYDNQTNQELITQATRLTQDCVAQKANPAYTGPKQIKDNPYYQNPTPGSGSPEYISGYGLYELMFNIW